MYVKSITDRGVLLWLIILSLATCGTVLAKTEIIHFDYTSHGPAYVQFLEERAQEFEALYDVEITFITGNQDKFEVMAVAGTPPDVVDLPALDLGTWVAQDYFLDLRPYLENSEYKNAINPLLLGHSTSSSGVLYQIPKSMNPVLSYFNRDLFREVGVPTPQELGDGWTWEAALDAGKKLTLDRDGDGVPEQFGMDRPLPQIEWAVHQAGGRFYDDFVTPKVSLWNTPEVIRAVNYVLEIFRNKMAPQYVVSAPAQYYYWTGKTAMSLNDGPGIIGAYMKQAPFDWDLTQQPKGPVGRATRIAIEGYLIPKESQVADLAWKWVEFLILKPENAVAFTRLTGMLPAHSVAQNSYGSIAGITDKNWMAIMEQLNDPTSYDGYKLDRRINPRWLTGTFAEVWNGTTAPEQFVEKTQAQTQAILDEINSSK